MTNGLMIAAPASNSGKTLVTAGLLRCLTNQGITISGVKSGPDYIDPQFHALATKRSVYNLDSFAMSQTQLQAVITMAGGDHVLIEGAMGYYDGGVGEVGSAAKLAEQLDIPVVLVIDAKAAAQSAVALADALMRTEPACRIKAVLFNRLMSDRHKALLVEAAIHRNLPVLGYLPFEAELIIPSRHLGLVQPQEYATNAENLIDRMAELIEKHIDIEMLLTLFQPVNTPANNKPYVFIPPPAQVIAVSYDECFSFHYQHLLEDWRKAGATLKFFSPLNNEAPDDEAEFIYLTGGYPELYAGVLSASQQFLAGLNKHAAKGTAIYGECGGYMVLGQAMIDKQGNAYEMAGLLPQITDFSQPMRTLGYRKLQAIKGLPFMENKTYYGHEFHYSKQITPIHQKEALFKVTNVKDEPIEFAGHVQGRVCGSYHHIIA